MKHSVHSAVVLDPVLSEAVHRRGEPHLTQLTWQQLMERYIHTIGSPSLIQSIRKYENNGYSIFQTNLFLKGLYTTINFYPWYHSSGKSSLRFHNMQRHHWIPYFSPAILIQHLQLHLEEVGSTNHLYTPFPFQIIGVDIMELPTTRRGNCYVVVLFFSKWPSTRPEIFIGCSQNFGLPLFLWLAHCILHHARSSTNIAVALYCMWNPSRLCLPLFFPSCVTTESHNSGLVCRVGIWEWGIYGL